MRNYMSAVAHLSRIARVFAAHLFVAVVRSRQLDFDQETRPDVLGPIVLATASALSSGVTAGQAPGFSGTSPRIHSMAPS